MRRTLLDARFGTLFQVQQQAGRVARSLRLLLLSCLLSQGAPSRGNEQPQRNIGDMTLEELSNLEVTSVSKKRERLSDAAASIAVITGEAIRRSGARSLPDALRLAPNLLVAQINATQYAISARGFNSSTANKLLVMIDGRTIYTPLYSGVFWDAQHVMLQDVDRIEVISGPGGTLWGANAVNGVINIITKKTDASTGNAFDAMAGNAGRTVALRHGAALDGERGGYRIYAQFEHWRHSERANGAAVQDAWQHAQMGFRTDLRDGPDQLTAQGDAYRGSAEQTAPGRVRLTGAHLLARWTRRHDDGAALRVQAYLDRTTRDVPGTYGEQLNTVDVDLQYTLAASDDQHTVLGGGYRVGANRVSNSAVLAFLPPERTLRWANLFVQQERALQPDLRLIMGIKAETNSYTGLEVLPSVKLAWKLPQERLLWAGLSRAVRAPSRLDVELYAPAKPPYFLAGNPDFRSEIATTLDIGWRANEGGAFNYAVTAFYSRYTQLRSFRVLPGGAYLFENQFRGRVSGLEGWGSYTVAPHWSLNAGMLLLNEHFSGPATSLASLGNDPHGQFSLGSRFNIGADKEFDLTLRRVGRLSTPQVPAYTALDAHFSWRISAAVEATLTGRNLTGARHQEFASGSAAQALSPIQMPRRVDVALTVRF